MANVATLLPRSTVLRMLVTTPASMRSIITSAGEVSE
jgi:hypothetical protein